MKKFKFLCTAFALSAVLFSCESESLTDEKLVELEPTTEQELTARRGKQIHVSASEIPSGRCLIRKTPAHHYLVSNKQSIWKGYGVGMCREADGDDFYVVDRNGKRKRRN